MEDQVIGATPIDIQTPVVDTAPVVNPVIDSQQPTPTLQVDPQHVDVETTAKGILQDYVQAESNHNTTNAPNSMDNFLSSYNYDPNEAGTYWVAGAINDNTTQMGFLQTIINTNMYDNLDLQKYYYDNNLSTARAYAGQKNLESAYGFYKAAQQKSLAEGNLTGYYLPPEAKYLLGQWNVAQEKLKDPAISEPDRLRATQVVNTANSYFGANKISTKGIETLSMMNYNEVVRHNKISEELQRQALEIERSGNAVNAASSNIELREFNFQQEEMEMGLGLDIDGNGVVGHIASEWNDMVTSGQENVINGYTSYSDFIMSDGNWTKMLALYGEKYIKDRLKAEGMDYEKYFSKYQSSYQTKLVRSDIESKGFISADSLTATSNKYNNKSLYTLYDSDGKVHFYQKGSNDSYDEVILTQGAKLTGGSTVGSIFGNDIASSTYKLDGKSYSVGVKDVSTSIDSYTNNSDKYSLSKEQSSTAKSREKEGWKIVEGAGSTEGINSGIVMSRTNTEGTEEFIKVYLNGDYKSSGESSIYYTDSSNVRVGGYLNNELEFKSSEDKKLKGYSNVDMKIIRDQSVDTGIETTMDNNTRVKIKKFTPSTGKSVYYLESVSIDSKHYDFKIVDPSDYGL